jgi:hypothetical protein
LINSSRQIGSALGVAALLDVATSVSAHHVHGSAALATGTRRRCPRGRTAAAAFFVSVAFIPADRPPLPSPGASRFWPASEKRVRTPNPMDCEPLPPLASGLTRAHQLTPEIRCGELALWRSRAASAALPIRRHRPADPSAHREPIGPTHRAFDGMRVARISGETPRLGRCRTA